jgi:hypothetical protein
MAFGCEGADSSASAGDQTLARQAAIGDAGVQDATDDGESADDGERALDGAVASLDGQTPASSDGAAASGDDQTDAAVQLSDNQIFGIMVANNDAELSAAAAGEAKLRDPATAAFAGVVTRTASSAKRRYTLLATVAGLTAEDSQQSADREGVAGDIDTMLDSEPASESLDLRYVFGEAMTNQLLVDLIDGTLSTQADSELLKAELRTARDTAQRRVTEAGNLIQALTPSAVPEASDPAAP